MGCQELGTLDVVCSLSVGGSRTGNGKIGKKTLGSAYPSWAGQGGLQTEMKGVGPDEQNGLSDGHPARGKSANRLAGVPLSRPLTSPLVGEYVTTFGPLPVIVGV